MDGSFVQHSVRVLQELNKQREKGQYCDATLDVGGLVFKAHWSVLACCSHFFQSLYGEGPGGSVVLPAGFAEIFGLLLDFFYTGHLALTSGNRDQVLLAARELRVPEAVELCQSFKPKATGGQASSGRAVCQGVDSHLPEPVGLQEEPLSRTLGLVPGEPQGSPGPQAASLQPHAQGASPSFLRGKFRQALNPGVSEDKEPEDCRVPPRPLEAEGAQLQDERHEVLCPGSWDWGRRGPGRGQQLMWSVPASWGCPDHARGPCLPRVMKSGWALGSPQAGPCICPGSLMKGRVPGVAWAGCGAGSPQVTLSLPVCRSGRWWSRWRTVLVIPCRSPSPC